MPNSNSKASSELALLGDVVQSLTEELTVLRWRLMSCGKNCNGRITTSTVLTTVMDVGSMVDEFTVSRSTRQVVTSR